MDEGENMSALTISQLETLTLKELYALAKEYRISYYAKLTKKELIFAILKAQAEKDGYLFMDGILEIIPSEGFGFFKANQLFSKCGGYLYFGVTNPSF